MATHTPEERLAEEEEHVEGLDGTGKDMSRIIGISDAVFAFSMTFLVITLVLPQVGASGKYPNILDYFRNEWSSLVAYLISFFVITAWWSNHRRIFSPIVRYDTLLVRFNNLFLLIIAITPFLVVILYDYGPSNFLGPGSQSTQLAVALFAAVQVIGGLTMLAIWHHSTTHHRLVEERLPAIWIRRTEQGSIYSTGVFAVSIPVAFVSPFIAMLLWIAMIFGLSRIRRKHRPHPTRPSSSPMESKAPPS